MATLVLWRVSEVTGHIQSFINYLLLFTGYKNIAAFPFYQKLTFSNLGLIMANTEMKMVMSRRLELERVFKKIPDIQKVPLKSPVFVFGLGRSGTTFVHRLLALDPQGLMSYCNKLYIKSIRTMRCAL